MRVGKLKNGKSTGKDEITGEMIKSGGDRVVDWIWRLCNMAFENGIVMGTEVPYRPSNIQNMKLNKIGKDNAKYELCKVRKWKNKTQIITTGPK